MKPRLSAKRNFLTVAAIFLSLVSRAAETIKPGDVWPDNRGEHIQAHGGGIL